MNMMRELNSLAASAQRDDVCHSSGSDGGGSCGDGDRGCCCGGGVLAAPAGSSASEKDDGVAAAPKVVPIHTPAMVIEFRAGLCLAGLLRFPRMTQRSPAADPKP